MVVDIRLILRFLLVYALATPWLVVAARSGGFALPPLETLTTSLLMSCAQAALSAMSAMLFGAIGGLGLVSMARSKWRWVMELFLLLPAWIPPLFVILAALNFVTNWFQFPFGIAGVVLVHVLMNVGLVAVSITRALENRLGGQLELAWIEGAPRWKFLGKVAWPQLKEEIASLFLLVFGFCFTSFAVPMVVGGGSLATLEVLLYQELLHGQGLGSGLVVALIEFLFLVAVGLLLVKNPVGEKSESKNLSFIAWCPGLTLPLLSTLIVLLGGGWSLVAGWKQFTEWPELSASLPQLMLTSFWVALSVSSAVVTGVALVAFLLPQNSFRRVLMIWGMSSTVVVGVAFMSLANESTTWNLLKLVLGLVILFFPALYKWLGDGPISRLREQVDVARSLGASWFLLWRRIILPQIAKDLSWIGALASLWATGEFALSNMILSQDMTLALVVESFMSSYRLELASFLMIPLTLTALAGALLWVIFGYVCNQKYLS